jgi:hypothetical protein
MLKDYQRETLINLSDVRKDNSYQNTNKPLEEYLILLRKNYSKNFYNNSSELKERVFFDQPSTIPSSMYNRHIRSITKSPYRMQK